MRLCPGVLIAAGRRTRDNSARFHGGAGKVAGQPLERIEEHPMLVGLTNFPRVRYYSDFSELASGRKLSGSSN